MSRLRKAGIGLTVAGSLAVGLIGGFEGMRTRAYIPIPGDVPTVCFGATRGVKMGDTHTPAECKAMLGTALVEFETNMRRCLVAPDRIPDKPYVAFLSVSYNIGSRAFCGSTIARKANVGDIRGACDALLAWNKAGGRVVQGLVNRRAAERKLCLEGL
jgi:lysozyme